MDKNGNSKLSPKPSKTAANPDDPPLVTWETSGEGKKIPGVNPNLGKALNAAWNPS